MVTLIAKIPFFYASRWHAAGDRFGANRQDARLLVALGRAVRLELESPIPAAVFTPPKAEITLDDVLSDEQELQDLTPFEFRAEPEISPRTGKPKRAYKRRDQQAEE